MKAVSSVASVLACAFSLDAQITASLDRLPNGADQVRIRNNHTANVVAFVVTVRQAPLTDASPNAPFIVYSDPLIEPTAKPLLAGEDRVVLHRGLGSSTPSRPLQRPFGGRPLEEPVISAGILSDGTTTGDPVLLARLILRRCNMLQAVESTLETLLDAGRRNIPREQLVEQFKKWSNSLNRWYLPPEQQVGRIVYQSMMGKLMNLPEEPLGTPFPPAAFVEQETAKLNRQRVTLLESRPSLSEAVFLGR